MDNESIKTYRKEYYEKNKERISKKSKENYQKNLNKIRLRHNKNHEKNKEEFLSKFKLGKSCSVCGWNTHPEILQFHHKDRMIKSFTIGNQNKVYSEKIEQEIKKCILLCPNCHAIIHLKERRK